MPDISAPATVRIVVGGLEFRAALEHERAPRTVAALLRILPLGGRLLQARWSGESAWVPLGDLDTGLTEENATGAPAPGQILLYPHGVSETELLVPYGATVFASRFGPLRGNHVLTLADGEALRELGRRVLWEGAQPIRIEVA